MSVAIRRSNSLIIHVDMDAFYASVEQRDNPTLVGKPVVVGGSADGRGVVSAASYEARKFGVHSAMPTSMAIRCCPRAILLPVRMEVYALESRRIRDVFNRFTPLVEPLSLDEAFLDVGGCEQLFGPATEIARRIVDDIAAETQLTASVGIAPNKFLAKVASDLEKPAGFVVVDSDHIGEFLDPLPVSRIWGVGKRAQEKLTRLQIRTVAHLRQTSFNLLKSHFGERTARHFEKLARGEDVRDVVPDRDAKSLSHERTFPVDISDVRVIRACLLELTEQVGRRLRRNELYAGTVSLKVRFDDFSTITRSVTLPMPTQSTNPLWHAVADELLSKVDLSGHPVRLLGVGTSHLSRHRERQQTLFADESEESPELDQATDAIRSRFGKEALARGSSVELTQRNERGEIRVKPANRHWKTDDAPDD